MQWRGRREGYAQCWHDGEAAGAGDLVLAPGGAATLESALMPDPVLVVVEDDAKTLKDVERQLLDRYAHSYRIVGARSESEGRSRLEELAAAGDQVALLLAGQQLSGTAGNGLLDAARHLYPRAKRGLLLDWGDWGNPAASDLIFEALACGRIDHYVVRPSASAPDELFHQAITSMLLEWSEAHLTSSNTIYIVGESWSGRAFELRETLERCAIPHSFELAASKDGRAIVARAEKGTELPIVVFPDGTTLANPSNVELARASGAPVNPGGMDFDLLIVGAGPAGLSAAVYGASEGFATLVVDEGGLGGQATFSSLIRNYLGFPRGVSGRRLAQQAYEQAWIFGAQFVFMQRVTGLQRERDGVSVTLSDFGRVRARAVLLATGASYRRLGVPALEALNGTGVFYGGAASSAPVMADREVYVLGGANSAGQTALDLARYARRVTLVVRADSLGAGMSDYLVREVEREPNLEVRLGTEIADGGGDGWLEWLTLRDRADGSEETVDAEALFVMIGARPHTEWLPAEGGRDSEGFILTGAELGEDGGWPLERSPFLLETGMPGVFAAGDVRHGSVKRVASAVGEGSVAIQLLHDLFTTDRLRRRGRHTESGEALEGETAVSEL